MPNIVRCGLIQAANVEAADRPIERIKKAMVDKHVAMIEDAAKAGVQIICLQELFYGPYFCAEQNTRWYELTESVPDGPTVRLMQKVAAKQRRAQRQAEKDATKAAEKDAATQGTQQSA